MGAGLIGWFGRFLWRWIKRLVFALVALVLLLLAPVAWNETMCRPTVVPSAYPPIITDPAQQRVEARTLLTYPEWHIVHAYDDYARVIAAGDPQDFAYLKAVWGFWDSLCTLSRASGQHGGNPWETKQMNYTIGISFTLELGLKGLYEETIGRLFVMMRGPERSPLDELSARMAADYATFLRQVPWYKWDFARDAAALAEAATPVLRDRERALALGWEFRAKAAYARVIARAVAGVGPDELTIRSIVTGLDKAALTAIEGVTVVAERPEGLEIETPRYAAFTVILQAIAAAGGTMVEIAGNDDIMFTALSAEPWEQGELFQIERQGAGDYRHLMMVRVPDLATALNRLQARGLTLEHVHDY